MNRWTELLRGLSLVSRVSAAANCSCRHPRFIQFLLAVSCAAIVVGFLAWSRGGLGAPGDWANFNQFNKSYAVHEVLAGRMPWWNPHIYLGRPFFADMEVALFYPLNFLFFFFYGDVGFYVSLLIHFVIGYLAMAKLTFEWGANFLLAQLSGLAWIAGGAILARANLGMLGYVSGLVWLPLALLYVERWGLWYKRRDGCKLVIVLTLMLLAGHPHQFWTGSVLLTIYAAVRFFVGRSVFVSIKSSVKAVGGVWLAYGFSFSIAAIQLIPFLHLLSEGNRGNSLEYAASFSMKYADLLGVVFSIGPWLPANHESSYFVGIFILVFGIGGLSKMQCPKMRGLAAFAVVGVLVGLGDNTPFFGFFSHTIPGLNSLRLPGRLAVGLPLALIVACACIMSKIALTKSRVWLSVGIAAVIIIDLGLYVIRSTHGYHQAERGFDNSAAIRKWAEELRTGSEPYPMRVLYDYNVAPLNAGMRYGFSSPAGYCALASNRVWQWLHYTSGVRPSLVNNTFPSSAIHRAPIEAFTAADLALKFDYEKNVFLSNPASGLRGWLAPSFHRVSNYMEAIRLMSQGFDYRGRPLVEGDLSLVSREGLPEAVEWVDYRSDSLTIKKSVGAAGIVVIAEAWYPGWTAQVDGRPREVFPVNGWMRGVATLAGEHVVVMSYHQPGFREGSMLTALSLLALLYFWWKP